MIDEPIVDRMNADFLWHSTVALKKALENKEKELNKLKRVIASMQS